MWVLGAHDGASAEHHLVLRQSAGLVREDVLDLAQVLRDVQGLALDAAVGLFVVQIDIVRDEEELADLHQLDGDVERDGNQDLEGGEREVLNNGRQESNAGSGMGTGVLCRHLQEDDHCEEHVKTRQTGMVPTTAAVGHQVRGHAG